MMSGAAAAASIITGDRMDRKYLIADNCQSRRIGSTLRHEAVLFIILESRSTCNHSLVVYSKRLRTILRRLLLLVLPIVVWSVECGYVCAVRSLLSADHRTPALSHHVIGFRLDSIAAMASTLLNSPCPSSSCFASQPPSAFLPLLKPGGGSH